MSLLLVYADAVPTDLAHALDLSGYAWKAVSSIDAAHRVEPDGGWDGAVVMVTDPEAAFSFCRDMRRNETPLQPVVLAVPPEHVGQLQFAEDLFDDFIVLPLREGEMEARLRHLLWRVNGGTRPDMVEYGALVLNLSTYQAAVSGRPLDMTYMEYELLKHFATNPGRVFTREDLLRTVWGYEYYGGACTVDVHVRRLRAKLGDEHANLIQTVRSVGYIFGRPCWGG